jgi:hypothetical protein
MKKKVQARFLQIQPWSSFSPKDSVQNDQKTLPRSRITHRTTKTKMLRIPPAMETISLAQRNNQQSRGTAQFKQY